MDHNLMSSVCQQCVCVLYGGSPGFTFAFKHLADAFILVAFIQSDQGQSPLE